jgi:putative ABC transport system permease protein
MRQRRPMGFIGLMGLRDLQWRGRRVAVAVGGAALVLSLTLVLSGFRASFDSEADETIAALDASGFYVAEGTSGPFSGITPFAPDLLTGLDPDTASPLVLAPQHVTGPGGDGLGMFVIGHEPGSVGTPEVSVGRAPVGPGEIVVDQSSGLGLGDSLTVPSGSLEIVGLTNGKTILAGSPHLYMAIGDAQDLLFAGTPLVTAVAVSQIPNVAPSGFTLMSPDEVRVDMLRLLEDAVGTINMMVGLLWIVAGAVIGSVMYLSAIERESDFAVLKAAGTTSPRIASSILVQATVLAAAAGLVSIGLAYLMSSIFPMTISYPAMLPVTIVVIAVVLGCVGSLGGLRRVLRIDPAAAFS